MSGALAKLLGAGMALALLQVLDGLVRGGNLFLTFRERAEFALATFAGLAACAVVFGLPWCAALQPRTSSSRIPRVAHAALLASAGAYAAWAGVALTAGRRVRDLPLRPWLVAGGVLLVLGVVHGLFQTLSRTAAGTPRARASWAASLGLLGVACFVADVHVLPRNYPAFHLSLGLLAVLSFALSVLPLSVPRSPRLLRYARTFVLGTLLAAPLLLFHLAAQPNASYAARESAPLTAKLLVPFERAAPDFERLASAAPSAQTPAPAPARGVNLMDRDVLMITVDALRADMLSALGGTGLTPEIDALVREGMLFRRAYTPAPHTSYALASLLTAKFIKPVSELSDAPKDHTTLPDLLKRYGYRTAAFYPPAVFFVDGARFQTLAERGFGFEYRKEMFARGPERVQQLSAYLDQAEPGHPLFVWVHLFEPHEPYEPPEGLATADSARGRYEGEVRAADRAIGALVALFRRERPDATVIVSADHGEEFGDHGGNYHGTTLFEEQVHIPLLWSSPGVVRAGQTDTPVELVDVGSTILLAAGIPLAARMRGDDLTGILAGEASGPRFAFASVEDRHMVCDGRFKAICSPKEAHCQLFDLAQDPKERKNLAALEPARVHRLRGELFAFLSSIAKHEGMGVDEGVGFPAPLVRARLGAPGAGPEVLPLLRDGRPAVRAAAARVLGELSVEAAKDALSALRKNDADSNVRKEAAVSALSLGELAARSEVAQLLSETAPSGDGLSLARRAAFALAAADDARAVPVLSALLSDPTAQESDHLRAIDALATFDEPRARVVAPLVAALAQVRLSEAASAALARVGGDEARAALLAQLAGERYEPARGAEARALVALGERQVIPLIRRFLGMQTSIPGGVRLLDQLGLLGAPGELSGRVVQSARRGTWDCDERGCAPGEGAFLRLPARASAERLRITLLVDAAPGAGLSVDGTSFDDLEGEQQLSVLRARDSRPLSFARRGEVRVVAWVAVPEQAEIPPPAPEPWDAGSARAAE